MRSLPGFQIRTLISLDINPTELVTSNQLFVHVSVLFQRELDPLHVQTQDKSAPLRLITSQGQSTSK